jgi:DsbC/DsbD-like thiol-disulfide interchange protein
MRSVAPVLGIVGLLLAGAPSLAGHSSVEVVLDRTAVPPGGSATVALVYKIEPGWHTYWINPGDAGAAPKVKWTLPPGVTVSDLRYPIPHRKTSEGLTSFIYENEVALLATVTVPADQKSAFDLTGRVKTVVCSDECVLEEQDVAIRVPVGDGVAKDEARFGQWRSLLPKQSASPRMITAKVEPDGKHGTLRIPLAAGQTVVDLFPPKTRLLKFETPNPSTSALSELAVGFSVLSELPAQWSGPGLLVVKDQSGQTSAEEIQFTFGKP